MKFLTIYVRVFFSVIMLAVLSLTGFYLHPYIAQSCALTTYPLVQKEMVAPLGHCPKCNQALRTVHGRFGDFIGCCGYPKCSYIQRKKACFACPTCTTGAIEERRWSGGILWGCSNYPDCRYAIFSDIDDNTCPACNKTAYMLKTTDKEGKTTLLCPIETCKHSITQ